MRWQDDPGSGRRFAGGVSAASLIMGALAAAVMALAPRSGDLPGATVFQEAPWKSVVSRAPGDGAPPRAPNPWFFVERAYPLGAIPRARWEQAQLDARLLREEAGVRSGSWQARGPTNIGGRMTDIAVDPTDDDVVYAAAAEGGVLRSRDAGQTWDLLFDDQASLSVGAIALDPSDPNVLYAGTGEVNPGGGSVAYGGVGIFRSRDQGDSWEPIGLEGSGSIGRIRVDPGNPDRIFVAAMGPLWETSPERGVYRTTNAGASWDRLLFVSDSTGCVDLVQRPDDPDVLFAAMWERIRRPEAYRYGGVTCGVYRTSDGGDTWSLVGGGLPAPSNGIGRIGLSLCASQPDVMHAIYADRIGYFAGLYRSTDGGASWSRTNDGALSNVYASYGWWFGNVRTHPIDPQRIYVLGLPFYRSTNGGASYSDASGIMHVDHHGLEFGSGPNPVLYNGNDGGVYRSTNGGTVWTKCPNLPVTQIYRVGLDANNPDALYCGAQDNGTCRTLTGADDDWTMIFGGDGFQPVIHPLSSNRIWAQYQYGVVYYSSNGGGGWSYASNGLGGDRVNWNAPHAQDPTDPDRRYFGTHRLHRNNGNTSWTPISPDLTGGPHLGNPGQVNGTLTTIRVSRLDGQVIWTGSDDGRVHVTTDGGASWSDVGAALPERWVTSVRTDPFARETAYVTISGFRWAEPLARVYRTTDLGTTWEAIAGNLPDAPVNDLLVDPDLPGRLFVAADLGVFQSVDGGGRWGMLGANLPNVVVNSLALDPIRRILYAGTYGRSFFAYALEDAAAAEEFAAGTGPGSVPFRLYPNPSMESTWIHWVARSAEVFEIEVATVSGRRIARLSGAVPADRRVRWDGRDPAGRPAPAGVYFVRLSLDGLPAGGRALLLQR